MKAKIVYKIIFLNLIILLLVLISSEFVFKQIYFRENAEDIANQSKIAEYPEDFYKMYHKVKQYDYHDVIKEVENKVYKGSSNKRPIVTIGCSYTAGGGLSDVKDTFAYKLNAYTGRTTYNRGVCGTGPQLVYRQLSDSQFKKDIPDAEYIIYTFIYNHVDMQFIKLYGFITNNVNLNYKIENDKLVEKKQPFSFMYFSYIAKAICEYITVKDIQKEYNNGWPLFYKTMEESVSAMRKNYPDSKFVFIEFPEAYMCKPEYIKGSRELTDEQIKKLKNLGIIYINAEKLVGHPFRDVAKYRIADQDHPNGKVWDEIVPALVKELNL